MVGVGLAFLILVLVAMGCSFLDEVSTGRFERLDCLIEVLIVVGEVLIEVLSGELVGGERPELSHVVRELCYVFWAIDELGVVDGDSFPVGVTTN